MTDMFAAVQATTAGDIINAYLSGGFLGDFVTVIMANLILSSDNAVVIALAARSLPAKRRIQGIILGTIAAIVVRIILTYCAAMVFTIPYMKLIGGLLILGIAVKLLLDKDSEHQEKEPSGGLLRVIGIILLADLAMSGDNVIAVAGASKGNPALLFLGLGISIPLVAFGSGIVSRIMARFPVVIYVGAGILGKVAAEMILADPLIVRIIHSPGSITRYAVETVLACFVIGTGMLWIKMREAKSRPAITGSNPFYVTGWDIR